MTKNEYFDQLDVPYHVRIEQTAWEQRHTLLRLWRIKGMTLKQLVPVREKWGCVSKSPARIAQICARAVREEKKPTWKYGSPVERWLQQQMTARNLYNELQEVTNPKPKPKPKKVYPKRPRPPHRPRILPYEWRMTWYQLPKIVDLPLSVPLPEGWTASGGQIAFVPLTGTTTFRVHCVTPQGERYCDLIIDRAWDGDTRPLFQQAINEITSPSAQAASGSASKNV